MKFTDTSEAGLEAAIVRSLVEESAYQEGTSHDYDRAHAVDMAKLTAFIHSTQKELVEGLGLGDGGDSPQRKKFLHRLQSEITKRGVIDVLRRGIKHGAESLTLFYGSPTANNEEARRRFEQNIFSVTRQLHYSASEPQLALDMAIFINGLPVATFELKNRLSKQTVENAVQQYKNSRNPKELLFHFARCMVHFAVDDAHVRMCTKLDGQASWFLPFNKGYNDGAGNPPNPNGLATDYLWKEILNKERFTDILENYAHVFKSTDKKTGTKKRSQIFPRYHQLTVVRRLLSHVKTHGVGERYLIQHSAGSGKSNSIAWLAHQLVELEHNKTPAFNSIIVVTDRRVLDKQICDTIKSFAQLSNIVGHANASGDLRRFINESKKIIITTIQKFPFILDDIGDNHRKNTFAIIIDEAHSSQGGRTASKMHNVLTYKGIPYERRSKEDRVLTSAESVLSFKVSGEESTEDIINTLMESHKMLSNASYFAFTATPKNKTLEIFGVPDPQADATVKHHPFHSYTMKQAIQEGFIVDVLKHYTPVKSFYHIEKKAGIDPLFDRKKAQKKLRAYVESHPYAIREKAEIMVDHFYNCVINQRKVGGHARALLATNTVKNTIAYFHAISEYLRTKKLPYKAIVAFSGEHEYGGSTVSESSLNGFSSNKIAEKIAQDPYRILVVADKFLTGYDEPLMHTMYIDKPLEGIKAVQTMSRLNRAHPQKYDTFILDFFNRTDVIQKAFSNYYQTTILSEETDPNRLHDLQSTLDAYQVYSPQYINNFVDRYLHKAERETLDPILDACVDIYNDNLSEDEQIDFKGSAKAFLRAYNFLSLILPYTNIEWEKRSIFLNFLVPKLPAPKEEDFSRGILETVDMDSYRTEVQATMSISPPDEDGELSPMPSIVDGKKPEPTLELASNIIKEFNDLFGNIPWEDADKIRKIITEEIPNKVTADSTYQNAMNSADERNARIEHDYVLRRIMQELTTIPEELLKQYTDNHQFKKWLEKSDFRLTYQSGN